MNLGAILLTGLFAGGSPAPPCARPRSYRPGNIAVKAGLPTTMVLRSAANDGCTRAFVIPSLGKQWTLPENGDVRIDLGVLQPGTLRYTCAMGMYGGRLTIT